MAQPEDGKRVLITGAGGDIGTVLRQRLRDRYELRLLSRQPIDEPAVVADLADFDAIRRAFDGIDVVVHLAAASKPESTWDEVLPANIVATYNVFEAARQAGVKRVVFASSSHAVGMYYRKAAELDYDLPPDRRLDHKVEPRPDSLYGVSKVFGEALGRFYHDEHGLGVVCLRIGYVADADRPLRAPADLPEKDRPRARMVRAIWLSHRDCVQLFRRAIDADVDWAVAYGTSDNARQVWDLDSARRLLGYRPQDRAPD